MLHLIYFIIWDPRVKMSPHLPRDKKKDQDMIWPTINSKKGQYTMIIDKRIKSRLVFPEPATCTPTPTSARTTHAASWAKKGSTYVNTFTHGADMKDRETGQT